MSALGAKRPALIAATTLAGALLAFQIVRTAAVADREDHTAMANALWPSHPAVLSDQTLLAVATAAARDQPVDASTRVAVRRIAVKDPLTPEPYLIAGAVAETEGKAGKAEQLLLAARDRDPRSRGARFLLADRYLRTGRVTNGLIEMQALVNLQSRGVEAFSPALVAYARAPGAVPQLRAFFARYPGVEAAILSLLSTDAANADLVLALASKTGVPKPDWRSDLVSALVSAGKYAKAYAVWARLSHVAASRRLFDPEFRGSSAPVPFNWNFANVSEGVAEADGKGGLSVLYYGRANAVLVSQLLMLPVGRYRLAMRVDGSGSEAALHWTLQCAGDRKQLADVPLRAGPNAADFDVPSGCEAQWLELRGVAEDAPRTTELTVRELRLSGGPAS